MFLLLTLRTPTRPTLVSSGRNFNHLIKFSSYQICPSKFLFIHPKIQLSVLYLSDSCSCVCVYMYECKFITKIQLEIFLASTVENRTANIYKALGLILRLAVPLVLP